MARKTGNNIEVEMEDSENEDVTVEETSEETPEEIRVESKVEKNNVAKITPSKTKIRVRVDHHCHIGGTNYNFSAHKVYEVPHNVKAILMRADLLEVLN